MITRIHSRRVAKVTTGEARLNNRIRRARDRVIAERIRWVEQLEGRVMLSSSLGGEFRVNTYTTGIQWDPQIAADADGDIVLVWQSSGQDGSDDGIYGQRFNSAGVAQGTEFLVNSYVTGPQRYPAVAMAGSGNFVVAWSDYSQDGSSYGIYAQRYDAAGMPLGTEFRVNTYTTSTQAYPALAMNDAGNFVVAWKSYQQDGSDYGIYAQRFDATGAAQGSEFRVNTYTNAAQSEAAVAMDVSGNFVVAWESSGQDGNGYGVYAQRYNASGVAQGSEFLVNTYTTSDQRRPAVTMGESGNFIVTWNSLGQDGSSNGVYAQRYNASGVAQGSEFLVNTYTNNTQNSPALGMDGSGNFVVAWASGGTSTSTQDGSWSGIYAQCYRASGAAQGAEFRVNTYTTEEQSSPVVAIDHTGQFVIAWNSNGQDGSNYGIYAQRYTLNEAPTTSGISNVTVNEDAGDSSVSLWTAFADTTDLDSALTYTITGNTNSALFTTTNINPATGVLTLDYAADACGAAEITLRATDTGGLWVEANFIVSANAVNDAPSFAQPVNQDVEANGGPYSIMLGAVSAGPANELQNLQFTATSSNTALLPDPTITYTSPNSSGTLAFTPVPDQTGSVTITVTLRDDGGTTMGGVDTVIHTFVVNVNDTVAPAVVGSSFLYAPDPHKIEIQFSESVMTSLDVGDLSATPLPSGVAIAPVSVSFNCATRVATFTFAARFPDGNYRATLTAPGVLDPVGHALGSDHTFDFFALNGDANRDRGVNFFDLTALAAAYGNTSVAWADGDFNADGAVNFFDLTALAANYGMTVPVPSAPLESNAIPEPPATTDSPALAEAVTADSSPVDRATPTPTSGQQPDGASDRTATTPAAAVFRRPISCAHADPIHMASSIVVPPTPYAALTTKKRDAGPEGTPVFSVSPPIRPAIPIRRLTIRAAR